MKKLACGLLITTIVIVLFASCSCDGGISEEAFEEVSDWVPKVEHYEAPSFTWDTPVSTSNGVMDLAEISETLSQLTNEDGTGEISLNMTWQEIAAVLDEVGIPYEVMEVADSYLNAIFASNGNLYRPYEGKFKVAQLKSGVKISDPISKVIEIYGEPDKVTIWEFSDNLYYYDYNMGKLYCKETDSKRTVRLGLDVVDGIITQINIDFVAEWNEDTYWDE